MRKFSLFSKNFHITPARPKAKGETKDVITNDQKLSILPTVYSKSKQEWHVMRYAVEKCWQVDSFMLILTNKGITNLGYPFLDI